MTGTSSGSPGLLERAARSAFWNAVLLPLISVLNLVSAMVLRRYFGFASGIYDIVVGTVNSLLLYSSLGIPTSLSQFVPRLEDGGRAPVASFLRRAAVIRFGLLLAVLAAAAAAASPLAARLGLGDTGANFIYMACALALFRGVTVWSVRALEAMLWHREAGLVQLAQTLLIALAILVGFARGFDIATVIGLLVAVALLVGVVAFATLRAALARLPAPSEVVEPVSDRRFWEFSLFMYGFGWFNYVLTPAFASPAIAMVTGSNAAVALFNVGLQIPLMITTLVLSGFRGLYRPLFARVLKHQEPDQVRRTFDMVSRVQVLMLLPAGVGLTIMVPDYVVLFFGSDFAAAAPIASTLTVLLFSESLFNVGRIMLTVDEQYRPVMLSQAARLAAVPGLIAFAAMDQLVAAAVVFGAGRLAANLIAYGMARRLYGVRFPVAFTLRVALPVAIMGGVVWALRGIVGVNWTGSLGLTVLGAVLVAVGLRVFRVIDQESLDLIRRSRMPLSAPLTRWFGGGV